MIIKKGKILITGGSGFIAKNLSENLQGKYLICSFDKEKLDLLNFSKVFDCLKKNKFDTVIHAATYDAAARFSTNDSSKVLENNLKMFFNIARCNDYFGKMIYFGSGAEFDRKNWKRKMKESYFDKYVPEDQYGFSKYVMTKYAKSSDNIYNLRLFGVFGKYDDWKTRFISNTCCRAVLGLPIIINQNKYYDFLYIDDLVKIVEWFITHKPKHKIYNVCSGKIIDFKTISEKIIKISNKNLKIKIKTRGLGREYSGNNSLLIRELNSFKFTAIDQGIKKLYDWHNQNKNIIKQEQL